MPIDDDIEFLNQKIAELAIQMEMYRGTDRYNQIGEKIDNLSMRLSMLEGEKDYGYWKGQEEPS